MKYKDFKFCHRLSDKLLTTMNILIGIVDISLYGVTSVAPVLREKNIHSYIFFELMTRILATRASLNVFAEPSCCHVDDVS